MKRTLQIVLFVLIMIACYVAAGPYLTVSAIKTGVINKDSVKLSQNIEFHSLRQNVKDQFNAVMIESATKHADDNPFAALAVGLATTMTDRIVDSLITPNGMTTMLQGKLKDKDDRERIDQPVKKEDLFKNARYSYDSINTFSVWVPVEDKEEVRMVLQRDMLTWKLVNIIIPTIDKYN